MRGGGVTNDGNGTKDSVRCGGRAPAVSGESRAGRSIAPTNDSIREIFIAVSPSVRVAPYIYSYRAHCQDDVEPAGGKAGHPPLA
jgi:hypothetical protein